MAMKHRTQTEHAGAKNGGGYSGKRAEAKKVSKRLRRARDKVAVRERDDADSALGAARDQGARD